MLINVLIHSLVAPTNANMQMYGSFLHKHVQVDVGSYEGLPVSKAVAGLRRSKIT